MKRDVAERVEAMLGAAGDTNTASGAAVPRYRKFPTAVLPTKMRRLVEEVSGATGTDSGWAALAALVVAAGAIGNRFEVRAKRSWIEPSVLWGALIGRSGTLKSPVYRMVLDPLERIQAADYRAHQDALAAHDAAVGTRPIARELLLGDVTIEKVAIILNENPGGVIVCRDELGAWIGGHNKYTGKHGGEESVWLSLYDATPATVHRVSRERVHVQRGAVSILGGIQPRILRTTFGEVHRAAGMLARFLLAYPPERAEKWTDADLSGAASASWRSTIEGIIGVAVDRDEDGSIRPRSLIVDTEGMEMLRQFVNRNGQQRQDADDDLNAALSKYKGVALRLALVVEVVQAIESHAWPMCVSARSMRAGIELAEWFSNEAARVYQLFTAQTGDPRELIAIIDTLGGQVTARYLTRKGVFADTECARRALVKLGEAGHGRLERIKTGGRPSEVFVLSSGLDQTSPPS